MDFQQFRGLQVLSRHHRIGEDVIDEEQLLGVLAEQHFRAVDECKRSVPTPELFNRINSAGKAYCEAAESILGSEITVILRPFC
jgi:hypothetical protein